MPQRSAASRALQFHILNASVRVAHRRKVLPLLFRFVLGLAVSILVGLAIAWLMTRGLRLVLL